MKLRFINLVANSVLVTGLIICLFSVMILMGINNPFGGPIFSINVTKSLPRGLYLIEAPKALKRGDLVYFDLPQEEVSSMRDRGYIPDWVDRFIKPVVAAGGDHVCLWKKSLEINGIAVGGVLQKDSSGRQLTPWNGCRLLEADEYFLVIPEKENSYDSRYYGPVKLGSIIGVATPIFTTGRNWLVAN